MKKLLYITTNLKGSGGVARVLSVKLNYLVKIYGYEIHVLLTNNEQGSFFYSFNNKIRFHKTSVNNISLFNLSKYKRQIAQTIDMVKPDVVVNCDNGLKGSLLPYFFKEKPVLIYEMHRNRDMAYKKNLGYLKLKLTNLILQRSINSYYKFIVLTGAQKNEWSGSNIQVLSNPITISNRYSISNKHKKIIAVGRYSYEKGYERLWCIWKQFRTSMSQWSLNVYGEGNKTEDLNKIKKMGIESTVFLNGPEDDIESKYAEASIFVNTSFSEALPLSMIEAMSCGLPAVAFETKGASELIEHNVNGLLINQGDINGFALALKDLVNDEERQLKMSYEAKKRVLEYGPEVIMKKWDGLFKSLASKTINT